MQEVGKPLQYCIDHHFVRTPDFSFQQLHISIPAQRVKVPSNAASHRLKINEYWCTISRDLLDARKFEHENAPADQSAPNESKDNPQRVVKADEIQRG